MTTDRTDAIGRVREALAARYVPSDDFCRCPICRGTRDRFADLDAIAAVVRAAEALYDDGTRRLVSGREADLDDAVAALRAREGA